MGFLRRAANKIGRDEIRNLKVREMEIEELIVRHLACERRRISGRRFSPPEK